MTNEQAETPIFVIINGLAINTTGGGLSCGLLRDFYLKLWEMRENGEGVGLLENIGDVPVQMSF